MKSNLKQVYLVGGAVRDKLLNIKSKDNDYVVIGETPKTMESLGFVPIGSDFPVYLHPKTKEEYALGRTERKSGKGYTGFVVDASPTVTLEEDLARRDLTINSMALDEHGNIIDPFNGQTDLQNKTLRHTTEAFVEDPVRVLRIARFLARYGSDWRIHPSTYALMRELKNKGELNHLVPERVWLETEKALGEKHPELYFEALQGLGIFPELERMVNVPQPANHHPEGDVFVHTMLVLRRAADLNFNLEARFAALTHDFGKALSFKKHGNLRGHEREGVAVIEAFCERLKVPNRFRDVGVLTSDNHTLCHTIDQLRPQTIHKLIVTNLNALVHPERFIAFTQACQCDAQGRGETLVDKPYPQAAKLRAIHTELQKMDKKQVVQDALKNGKKGPEIGEEVKLAEINCIKAFLEHEKSQA
ncbi:MULTISPECIES: multifunctional CCA addition/repair protein [Pseudoalteromonas]|uniref:Multifunctional CCA addition/repair protein n=1 Tax=Pseudoalteromonas distincta TaxID=77608 RepID=A0A4P9IYR4_9GAMM|nr:MULTISPECIES: multifunctional CCA addition/repair protein [Pseudoalteromonas]KHM49856.1 tRNA nucleotidyltransferase [Pseudoalteromonas elyakovii]KID40583.1 tRNA nucleotidyltransferase [Pseudoalteromonas distincta]MBB1276200.1 multifunctional CCA addition/repair protein [Pseudoalteromonas sp. SR43-3]MDP4482568.1 multifunctional CCA addition/repair protein [Pseudoalteromonas elyakovii]QCU73374.1 multifunctional CCA addition/repair protein [Pseudoalteromonas distincta]